jgi:carbapenam-3-carboxylate synthase
MAYSFFAVNNSSRELSRSISGGLTGCYEVVEAGKWTVVIKSISPNRMDGRILKTDVQTCILIGTVSNIDQLYTLALAYHGAEIINASPVLLIKKLKSSIGTAVFSLMHGGFTFLEFDKTGISIATDALGMQPVHFVQGKSLWITSELKHVGLMDATTFEFEDENTIINSHFRVDHYTPIKNARKAKPGSIININNDSEGYPYFEQQSYLIHRPSKDQHIAPDRAKLIIHNLLTTSTSSAASHGTAPAAPVSGGLDSSIVASLCVKATQQQFSTFAIGTNLGNEFAHADLLARHLETQHKELIFDDDHIMNGLHEAIYYNEIFDGLSAEIHAGLMCLYKAVSGAHDHLITGYGADLLFGGVLSPDTDPLTINSLLWNQIYRTRWTGEFSPFGAAHYGVEVSHPYWTLDFINFAANLNPHLKIFDGNVKIILRKYAEEYDLLPEKIIWRKKIGIHEGSSINKLFGTKIDVAKSDYVAKTKYTYSLFKKFLTNQLSPSDIGPSYRSILN